MSAGACKVLLDLLKSLAAINAMFAGAVLEALAKPDNQKILEGACQILRKTEAELTDELNPLTRAD